MTYCGHWRSNISVGVALIYLPAHVRLFTRTQAFSRATTEHIPQVFWVWGKAVALLRYHLSPLRRTLREQIASYEPGEIAPDLDPHPILGVVRRADNHCINEFSECHLRFLAGE
jgi:hypothetical protein